MAAHRGRRSRAIRQVFMSTFDVLTPQTYAVHSWQTLPSLLYIKPSRDDRDTVTRSCPHLLGLRSQHTTILRTTFRNASVPRTLQTTYGSSVMESVQEETCSEACIPFSWRADSFACEQRLLVGGQRSHTGAQVGTSRWFAGG